MSDAPLHVRDIPLVLVDEPDAATRQRIDPAAIDELAMSMTAHGQLQPGGVVPVGERFTIIFGHRRYLAARKLGLPFYRATVYPSTTEAMLGAQLDENVIRQDLTPVEEAHWFAQLLDGLHCGTDELADRLHKTRDYVERRLNLLRGHAGVLAALADGAITIGVAEALNTIGAPGPTTYLLDAALRTHPTRHTVLQWIAEWRASGAHAVEPSAPRDPDAPPSPESLEPAVPTCAFCGDNEEPWTMQFEWIHKHCLKARNRMLDDKFQEGPVRHG